MSTYKELLKEREALELKISTARRDEMASAIAQVRAIMDEYGLTQQEIFPTSNRARSATSGTKVAPKYRDPASGQTWTGRGKAPKGFKTKTAPYSLSKPRFDWQLTRACGNQKSPL